MKAVIFAAGLGTRLRPLTDQVPKPMIEIGGKPILRHTLEALPASVSEAVIVIGYKGGAIRDYFENAPGFATPSLLKRGQGELSLRFVEQSELRGTYDALLRARPLIDGAFLALNGDDLYAKDDLERLAAAAPFTMLARRVAAPNPYSHLVTEDGLLRHIALNKDSAQLPERLVYVGACRLDARFFALEPALAPNGELGLPHTLEKHLALHPVAVLEAAFWMPIGTPDELAAARRTLTRTAVSDILPISS